jgi:hypothetical protein
MGAENLALIVGSLAAAGVGLFAHVVGYDRDRAFYATVLTVVGMLYVLFAVMAGGRGVLVEVAFFAAFAALAAAGFRWSMWTVAAGLALHGLFDFIRYSLLVAPGAPSWWPAFCGSYDVVAALGLAALLLVRPQDHMAKA